jgi:hypothetical protein
VVAAATGGPAATRPAVGAVVVAAGVAGGPSIAMVVPMPPPPRQPRRPRIRRSGTDVAEARAAATEFVAEIAGHEVCFVGRHRLFPNAPIPDCMSCWAVCASCWGICERLHDSAERAAECPATLLIICGSCWAI